MPTDSKWTWTILMRNGKFYHVDESIDTWELLRRFEMDGHHDAEIEAIIRH